MLFRQLQRSFGGGSSLARTGMVELGCVATATCDCANPSPLESTLWQVCCFHIVSVFLLGQRFAWFSYWTLYEGNAMRCGHTYSVPVPRFCCVSEWCQESLQRMPLYSCSWGTLANLVTYRHVICVVITSRMWDQETERIQPPTISSWWGGGQTEPHHL